MRKVFRPSQSLKESDVTEEHIYRSRRTLLKSLGFVGASALLTPHANALSLFGSDEQVKASTTPLDYQVNPNYRVDDAVTPESKATSYNNFYEFGTAKDDPVANAQKFISDPWKLEISGLVEKPITLDYDDLFKRFVLEERIYRFRCVEAWSMVIPWTGFQLSELIRQAAPLSKAKYVAFETLYDPDQFPGQKSRFMGGGIDYPYVEALRLDEAMHPLTMLSVGVYGKSLPPQNGAPIRLVVPWKYGFKSIKSIVKITLTDQRPPNTWNLLAPQEYGFYANVNPQVYHPRWSQASERRIDGRGLLANSRQDTLMFNGYEEVASLYSGLDLRRNY